jgi:hypothetical protein
MSMRDLAIPDWAACCKIIGLTVFIEIYKAFFFGCGNFILSYFIS